MSSLDTIVKEGHLMDKVDLFTSRGGWCQHLGVLLRPYAFSSMKPEVTRPNPQLTGKETEA